MKKMNFKKIATNVIGTSLGAIVADEIFDKVPIEDTKIKAGAFMIVGALIGELMPKSNEAQAFGAGVIAQSATKLYQSTKLGTSLNNKKVAGFDDSVIAGDEPVIAGLDEDDNYVYGIPNEEGEIIGYINEFGEEVEPISGIEEEEEEESKMSGFEEEEE